MLADYHVHTVFSDDEILRTVIADGKRIEADFC